MRNLTVLILLLIATVSCKYMGIRFVGGDGNLSVQSRNVGGFEKVEVTGPMDVELVQGSFQPVRVESDQNLQEYILVETRGNTLHIGTKRGTNIRPKAGWKIYVSAPDYRGIDVTGSGDVIAKGRLTGQRLNIGVTGSGNVHLDLDMPEVAADITGSGTVHLKGTTRSFRSEITGSGDIRAYDLMSEETKVEIAGSGDAQVFASKQLKVDIAGSGDVAYKGTAAVSKTIHGSGSVRKID